MVLRSSHRVALPALPIALASATTAGAAVIYTNPEDLTANGGSVYWDMGSNGLGGSADNVSTGSDDFVLTFGTTYNKSGGGNVQDLSDPRLITQGSAQVVTSGGSKPTVRPFSPGEMIDANSLNFSSGDLDAGNGGYVGLSFNGGAGTNYGWAQIGYNGTTLALYDFAYESQVGVGIAAGATSSIPEPSAAAGIAGLLAGSAALYSRRRREPLAA
jgi:hypothetical protein